MSPAAGAAMRAVLAEMGEERAFEAVIDPKPLPAREAAQWQRHLLRRNAIEYVRGVGYWASCVPPACLLGGRAASPEVGLLHACAVSIYRWHNTQAAAGGATGERHTDHLLCGGRRGG